MRLSGIRPVHDSLHPANRRVSPSSSASPQVRGPRAIPTAPPPPTRPTTPRLRGPLCRTAARGQLHRAGRAPPLPSLPGRNALRRNRPEMPSPAGTRDDAPSSAATRFSNVSTVSGNRQTVSEASSAPILGMDWPPGSACRRFTRCRRCHSLAGRVGSEQESKAGYRPLRLLDLPRGRCRDRSSTPLGQARPSRR